MTEEIQENNLPSEEVKGTESPSTPETPGPSWWLDEKTPGIGDRPEWLPEKFKNASDLAKSYNELQKKLGQSGSGAPKEYDLGEHASIFKPDNEIVKKLMESSKANGLSQKAFSEVMGTTAEYINSMMIDEKAEMEKLGENAKERIEVLNNWASANLSKEAASALYNSMVTADAIKAIEEIRAKFMTQVPNGSSNTESNETSLTYEKVQSEISNNYDKYTSDVNYREEMRKKLEAVASSAGFVDKN